MVVQFEPSLLSASLALGKAMHQESRYKNMGFSETKITQLLTNQNCFCALAKSGENYIGFIFGLIQESWFCEEKIGFDLGLYVLPEYRGKGLAALRLIQSFERHCKSKGCSQISLSSSASIYEEKALRLYEKLGYIKCGFTTYKNFI